MTGAYAAGDMIGTAADLARFLGALIGGKLLPPDITADMVDNRRPGTMATPGTRLREAGAGIWLMRYAGHDVSATRAACPAM